MKFINFAELDVAPFKKEFAKDIIEGSPEQNVWSYFLGANSTFKSGMWDSTAGVFHVSMNDQIEFCHVLEGEARIEAADGTSRVVKTGDSFVMDNGLQTVWYVDKYIRKHYVIVSVPK